MALSDLVRAIFSLFQRAPQPAAAAEGGGTHTGSPEPANVPPAAAATPVVAPVVPVSVTPSAPGAKPEAAAHEPEWLVLCRPLTEASESCRLVAYPDPASGGAPWTIGWGATGPGIIEGTIWTREHADSRLTLDLNARADIVDRLVKVVLTPAKKAALVDFVFNVGEGNFESSTLLKRLNAGDYLAAADEFPKWNLAHGKVMPGLVTRRARERDLFLTGKWSAA